MRLVDRQTRETVLSLSGPEGVVNALTVDESRKWVAAIVVSSDSHGWVLWNIKSPDNPVVTPTMDMPRSIALSPTGEQLAVGFTQHVQIFDVSQATNGPKIELKETPHFVNYSRDGKLLAINNRVFNALSGEQKYDLRDSASTLPSPFLLQNLFLIDRLQRPLVTASSGVPNADRNRALLRLESDGRWTTLLSDVSSSVQYAFSSDDRLMAIMEEDDANQRYAIAVFGVESGKRVKRLGGHSSRIDSLVFSPDGKKLASIAMMNGVIRIWDLAQEVNTLPVSGEDK